MHYELRLPPSIEQLRHVLDQVHAQCYGLLISPDGAVILSTIRQESFAQLEPRYRAATTGLCFWWENGLLTFIEEAEIFLMRVRTLPSLVDRDWRGI